MNANKVVEGDWQWYVQHYLLMGNYSLSQYMGSRIGWITIKWNEPVYYAMAMFIASITGSNVAALSTAITIIDYGLAALALLLIAGELSKRTQFRPDAIILLACLLLAVTFTIVTQLVRQEMAACIVFLGYALAIKGQRVFAATLAGVGVLTHQSSLIFVIILYAPLICSRFSSRHLLFNVLIIAGAITVAFTVSYLAAVSGSFDSDKNDGSISAALITFDILCFVLLLTTWFFRKPKCDLDSWLIFSYVLFISVMIPLLGSSLALLRLYFYLDFLRVLAILLISSQFLTKRLPGVIRVGASSLLLASALLYVNQRVVQSPFDFGGTFLSYLSAFPVYARAT